MGQLPDGVLGRPDAATSIRAAVARFVARLRGRHLVVVDALGTIVAANLAFDLRSLGGPDANPFLSVLPIVAILLVVRFAANVRFGLYSRRWRFASVPDLERIVAAALIGSVGAFAIYYIPSKIFALDAWAEQFPPSFWLVELMISGAVLGGVRFAIRAASDWAPMSPPVAVADGRGTLLYGAGRTGVLMAGSARRKPDAGVRPVGFLDDDPHLAGGLVANLPVFGGLDALDRAIAATGAEVLLITMPSAPGKTIRGVVDAAMARGLDVRTVPSMNHLLDGTLDAYRVRRVEVEDLLRRTTDREHAEAVRDIVQDRTILITGAGGSIGSELARQVYSLAPRRLVLVDRAESALYLVQRELEAKRGREGSPMEIRAHLANVASRPAMHRLISTEKPDIILHAAAYKHVPMMEEHPSDAVYVNVEGTLSLLDAAIAADVPRFVLVSTDKAVRPSSVMGASKRIAEMLVADAAHRSNRPYVSVRFGNVLGSNGSVVPIFQEQLERSEPLTITHPEMSRYFMTISEAAWLIVDAAALGKTGDLFVLDMGEPIRIVDLARDLVRLAGRDPDTQPIDIVGLRQGEKLHEELFYEMEQVEPTAVPKVLRAHVERPPDGLRDDVAALIAMANDGHEAELRTAVLAYASEPAERPSADVLDDASLEATAALWAVPMDVPDPSQRISIVS